MNYKGFHQLQWEDRLTLERMLKVGVSKVKIAEALGVCRRTVYNEIKRGLCKQQVNECDFEMQYCADVAERRYQENLRAKGPDLKIGNDHAFAEYVEHMIVEEHYSPGAVLATLKDNNQFDTDICESTLYNYIYRGDVFLVLSPEHLPEQGRRHPKTGHQPVAAKPPRGDGIEHRDPEVASRTTFGHWELDSVMGTVGSKRALLVFTERLSRDGILVLVENHTAASTVQALNRLERRFGKNFYHIFKSITVDNGCEFMDYEGMEKSRRRKGKRTSVYYCHPYSPHERGSNENMNRLIRRFFPKGTNFDEVDPEDIRRVEKWINSYPRKVLGWRSSEEVMAEYLAV